jgi:hypothetical protein
VCVVSSLSGLESTPASFFSRSRFCADPALSSMPFLTLPTLLICKAQRWSPVLFFFRAYLRVTRNPADCLCPAGFLWRQASDIALAGDCAECFSCCTDRQALLGISFLRVSVFGAECSSWCLRSVMASCLRSPVAAQPEETLCAATVVFYSSFAFCFRFSCVDYCRNSSRSYS